MSERPYPVNLKLHGKRVVVIGGGPIAEGKVESLRGTGATIEVIAVTAVDRLRRLADEGEIHLILRPMRRRDLLRATLVVAATGDRSINRRVRRWAHLGGAIVNVVDDPALCDVMIPAVVHRGPATIAITTNGASPAAARFVREQIERTVPVDVADLIDHATMARRRLRSEGRYRYDYPAWRQRFFEPGWDAVLDDRRAALDEIRRRFLAGFGSAAAVRPGQVTLVGAGPGGVDLLTIGGAKALSTADIVVYDRLADPCLLDLAPQVAERIPVGKSKGAGMDQADINRLLVERAAEGFNVVRLKGGDPFVFGRGFEEMQALSAAGIDCVVVPGVSSALAAPALAGIPVTHRGCSASFTVVSAHRIADADYDWDALAASGETLVVLMGASTGVDVAKRLKLAGRPGDEPVAVVHRIGHPDSRTARCTLDALAETGSPFPAPVVIVVGPVAALDADPGYHSPPQGITPTPTKSGLGGER